MINVLDNALRHNPPGTSVAVTAGVSTNRRLVTISVTDDGRGLPLRVGAAVAAVRDSLPAEVGTGIAATIGLLAMHGGAISFPPVAAGLVA